MEFVLIISGFVAVTSAYPQYQIQGMIDDQFLNEPPSSCRTRRSDFNFPRVEIEDPFQRSIRSAVEASLPFLMGQDLTPVPSAFQPIVPVSGSVGFANSADSSVLRNVRSAIDSITPLLGVQLQDPRDAKNGQAVLAEQTVPSVFRYSLVMPAAPDQSMFPLKEPVAGKSLKGSLSSDPLAQRTHSEEMKADESKPALFQPSVDVPARGYGLYYMRVQSFNADGTKDEKEEIKADAKPKELMVSNSSQLAEDRADVIEALQELLVGQLAMFVQQQQVEEVSQRRYRQQEMHLKEILRQLASTKTTVIEVSNDKIQIPEPETPVMTADPFLISNASTTSMTTSTVPTESSEAASISNSID